MQQYSTLIQEGGRIVISNALRKAFGLEKGDRVTVGLKDGVITVSSPAMTVERLQKTLGKKLASVDEFISEKRREAKREIKKLSKGRRRAR